ncbi:extracellular solute-binding protein [Paenibacillus psychroresistens]|uniref:Extracellular solute-binding protein n=1 Tax=Paenibacillus psychroresistens TaxID=1778678 RepID=A0A6B8RTB8_9BACL|nr:extracellular solute-binding protein [Paenibacillus psychroresistens]QGQ99044.1 extracellular solute-binding protein [Paenibacillus psychroresistens]
MNKHLKPISIFMVIMILMLSLAACTKSSSTPSPTPEVSVAPATSAPETVAPATPAPETPAPETATPVPEVELSGEININLGSTNNAGWNAIAKAYTALHPKVKVNVELKPAEGYADWLRAQLSSDQPAADIVNNNVVADLIKTRFVDLKPYYDQPNAYHNNEIWKDAFKDFSTQSVDSITGGIYNINLETVQVAWFYNKSAFVKAGIATPPTTWDELVEACKKLKAAGYIPIGIGGDFDSFWAGSMGWLARIYADSATRTDLEKVRCQPNDYCYDPEVDGVWKMDLADPHNDDDAKVNKNPLRQALAVKTGDLNVTNDGYKTLYTNYKKIIPEFVEPGFFGTKDPSAYTLFLTQKAAIRVDGAWLLTSFDKDLKDSTKNGGSKDALPAFEYGVFPMPNMSGAGIQAPVRTIEVPIGFIGAIKKDQAHNDLVVDFLKYYASSIGYSVYLDATLKDGQGIAGPPIIKGITLEPQLQEKFDALKLLGNSEKGNAMGVLSRGIYDYQPLLREWVSLAQEYFSGKKPLDTFLTAYQKSIDKNFEKAIQSQKMELVDLDTPEKKQPERK